MDPAPCMPVGKRLSGATWPMTIETTYKYLEPRAGSQYRQLFLRGRKIRAEIFYRATLGAEARTPEEVAQDFEVPVEAVYEALHYCRHHEDLLWQEREEVLADLRARGLDQPPFVPGV